MLYGFPLQSWQLFLGKSLQWSFACLPLQSQTATAWVYGNIAQLVEHSTENAGVVGSIPTVAT
jgi:hypothetical protein